MAPQHHLESMERIGPKVMEEDGVVMGWGWAGERAVVER